MLGEEISGIAAAAIFGISQADARGTESGAWVSMALYLTDHQALPRDFDHFLVMVFNLLISSTRSTCASNRKFPPVTRSTAASASS